MRNGGLVGKSHYYKRRNVPFGEKELLPYFGRLSYLLSKPFSGKLSTRPFKSKPKYWVLVDSLANVEITPRFYDNKER
jgi:hypothetical protein|tara:strand:- start:88 stop:321 length:234 start_codon:yes stop_codon:yes gene_type:complete